MELHPLEVASFRLEQGFGLKSALNTRPFNLEISKLVKKCLQFSFNDPWFYFSPQHTLTGFIPNSWCSKRKRFRLEQGFGLKSALNTRPFNLEISKLVKKCLQFSFNDPWFYFCQQHTLTGFIPQSRCSKRKLGETHLVSVWSTATGV